MTIIKKYPIPAQETAALRYERDYKNIPILDTAGNPDDRHDRTLLEQSLERKSRRYVDNNVSAVTGGAPIFGSDSSSPGGGNGLPAPLWVDNFQGPEFDPAWEVIAGTPSFNPLSSQDGQLQIERAFDPTDYQIDVVGTFSSGEVVLSHSGGGVLVFGSGLAEAYISESGAVSREILEPITKFSARYSEGVSSVYINDVFLAENTIEAMEMTPGKYGINLTIGSNETGPAPTISSMTFYDLSTTNPGGGTPEVSPGTYTETYMETY